jgi:hypothetical protein
MRESAEMTASQVDRKLGWADGKLARMERGDWIRPNPRDVRDLLDVYEVTDEVVREKLLTLARQGRERGWWHPYRDMLSPPYTTYIGLEAEAASVRTSQLIVIPGLLQTGDYARSLISTGPGEVSEEEVARRVQLRETRQELLTQEDDPLRLWAVMDEAALRRGVGGRDVMRAQMRHLLDLGSLARVTLQVIPFDAGAHPGTAGPFSLLEFPHPDDPEAAYVETVGGELFIENLEEVKAYRVAFERLTAFALTPPETLRFIADLTE